MKKVILGISVTIASLTSMAQINVFSGNNVGIGAGLTSAASNLSVNTIGNSASAVTIAPSSSAMSRGLHVTNLTAATANFIALGTTLSNSAGSTSVLRGVWGYSYNASAQSVGQSYGILGTAGNCTSGYNYAVWGNLLGTNNGTAVYGQVGTTAQNPDGLYAGYFVGNVKVYGTIWASSTITSSDQKLKKNIAVLDSSDRIFDLKPKKYNLKTKTELLASGAIAISKSDTGIVATAVKEESNELTTKKHFGLLAQDVQKVYPDLVYTSGDGTLGVDYQGLIPIIIAQLQIMKQQIDAKEARIVALEQAVAKLNGKK
jgi:hypothetical protein